MNNFYPDELIEDVRLNNDIVDVISEYVRLEKKGKDFFGLCPFHKEKTPSFSVVPAKQIFYCFGCGKGGNVIHFIMNAENLDYIEAVKYLADRAKIQLPEGNSQEDIEKVKLKQEIVKINTEAARFFFNELNQEQNSKARNYLNNRALNEKTVRKFGIGYSSEAWDALYKYLINKGFDEKTILKSGLVLTNKNGGYYDRFRARVMFPIFDIRGNVIGFGGRVMDSSMPKYMNSPETPVYSKGRHLYALNFAKSSGEKRIIVVEGYMDAVSLHQHGITNVVASLGTALTESQGRLLKKYYEEIIISYDADTAGQAATMRGLDLLNDIGCNVRVLQIPDGKDPDEFIKKNSAEAFKKLVDNSISLVEYKIKALKTQINLDTTQGRISFLNKIADTLAKVDNRVEMEMYIKKLAKEYEISEESMYSEVYRRIKPREASRTAVLDFRDTRKQGKSTNETQANELLHDERMLLALLCIDNGVYKLIKDRIRKEDFINGDDRNAFEFIVVRLENNRDIVPAELLDAVSGDAASDFSKIIQKECNCEDNNKAVLDIIKRIELYKSDKRKQEILELLNDKDNLSKGDVEKLTLELNSLILKRKSI